MGLWEGLIAGREVGGKAGDPMFGEKRQRGGFGLSLEVDIGGFANGQ